jgi:hypothetical protein
VLPLILSRAAAAFFSYSFEVSNPLSKLCQIWPKAKSSGILAYEAM